jgi:hypothetical protein
MKTIFTTWPYASILFASCGTLSTLPGSRGVSETEAAEGIRQALQQGTGKGIAVLNHRMGSLEIMRISCSCRMTPSGWKKRCGQ